MQKGNAANAKINGEWGKHVKSWMKRMTAGIRRQEGKEEIKSRMTDYEMMDRDEVLDSAVKKAIVVVDEMSADRALTSKEGISSDGAARPYPSVHKEIEMEFLMYLTGHDRETIEQMYEDFTKHRRTYRK